MQVSSPEIRRVELRHTGAFAELIDNLEFDVEGEVTLPDVIPPVVNIVRPESGARLTSESAHLFLQETRITTSEFMLGFCIPGVMLPNPLVMDDFASDPMDQFEIADDPGAGFSRPSSWTYDTNGQRIVQTSNIHGPGDHVNTRPDKPGTYP